MTTSRFIYLPLLPPVLVDTPNDQIACLSLLAPDEQWISCTLAEVTPANNPQDIYLFLPNLHILSTHVIAPKKQQKHLTQILPFLCEDKLAGDIEEIHLVAGRIYDETVCVRAIQKTLLETLLHKLGLQGIHPRGIFSDAEPLLRPEDTSLWLSPACCLLVDQYGSLTLHPSQTAHLAALLQDRISQQKAASPHKQLLPEVHTYRHPDLDSSVIKLQLEELRTQSWIVHEHPLRIDHTATSAALLPAYTAQGIEITPQHYPNLLTGPYTPARQSSRKLNWQSLAWVASAFIGLNLLYLLASGVYFDQRAHQLQQGSEQLYRQYFPQDRRVVNIRTQTQSHLNQGRQGADQGFLSLLTQLQPGWEQHKHNLQLTSLRYHDQRRELLLDIESKTIGQLDQLQQTLGPQAELLSANEDNNNRTRGRIKFQGNAQ